MILIVDDNKDNIFSLMQLLEINGFDAEAAYSGEEALIKALKKHYTLIILDVQMPGMDGFEVAAALTGNSKTKDIPIIFLSAVNTGKKFITKGYDSGAIDYITKPFDADLLLLKIRTFQRLSKQTRELNLIQENLLLEIETRKQAEAQKDIFVGIASHELKTPLTSLKGFLQMLEQFHATMDKDAVSQFLASANMQVNKLTSLINELLDLSLIENGKIRFNYTDFNFRVALGNTIAMMQQIHPEIRFVINGQTDISVYGDQLRIEQVLINYLSNAVKYSPGQNEVMVSAETQNGFLKLTVTDSGIGIPADKIHNVFHKFFRVEEDGIRFQGMGIGLFICSEIIERHGGKYGVESVAGKGSSFYFTIPLKK